MMKYYQELELKPQDEISIHFLWSKVFHQIHLGLVEMQDGQGRVPIGVSFPGYVAGEKYGVIGSKLQLLAEDDATLTRFNAAHWLSRLEDYVHCTRIREVPANKITGYAFFKRVRPDSNNERLARRRVKRKAVSFNEAMAHYGGRAEELSNLPYIQVTSQSSGQGYALFIAKVETSTQSTQAVFSTYGLSSQCAVPLF